MSAELQTAWIGMGANLGDARLALQKAVQSIAALPQTRVLRVSSLYGSAPVDATGPDYLNAVAEISTSLSPFALLDGLQAIERDAGRERPYRNAPRTLDLDIVRFGDLVMTTERLTLPHPRWNERAFVLLPMAELLGEQVLTALTDRQKVLVAEQRIERKAAPAEWCPSTG
ncbi:2-amino-4-hydroxy-6-hydroxymethyldihydropteridine diphosphokinase [Diaphorobacter sp. HDW4B]|uniref:2-amino-4-hydroxy-6- hydroxymethyldihydropteridine diphosphokinase n=1 Tax=Diaphorobacter sp. HDW4B TaxID=2714925 RepID=UPI00140E188F|nr:2-amino-4-hydroxy-6-hydroxymethyldihydropteridine diphosphokinase [Diaphorobacter sp. HDW4B]QIL72195.1 2-amino-4-hydroxy-6-hydroxymethyldihydropteridine diphosphokinase [Diaphorobacter sp. HDW4B]